MGVKRGCNGVATGANLIRIEQESVPKLVAPLHKETRRLILRSVLLRAGEPESGERERCDAEAVGRALDMPARVRER